MKRRRWRAATKAMYNQKTLSGEERREEGATPGRGHRLLKVGETVRRGDQYWSWPPPQNGWADVANLGHRVTPQSCPHRRLNEKGQPQPPGSGVADTENL